MKFNSSWRLCAAALSLMAISACSEPEPVVKAEVVRPAKLIEVKAVDNIKEYRFPAVVEALSSKDLVFQQSGQIIVLNVREGDQVKQGQVIAELDRRVYQNQLDAAQTQLDTAKIEFERAQRLMAADAIAKSIFDQRESNYNVAITGFDNAKKALEDTRLLAPFSGLIANTYVDELDAVTPASPIATIQTAGPAEAKVKIPASLVSHIKQITPVETYVILDSDGTQPLPASMVGAIGLADERSQTFEVSFKFTPLEGMTVFPGMTGVVVSRLAFTDEAGNIGKIFVPMGAVLSDANGQYVWVVDKATYKVSRRNVVVGELAGDTIAINTGLRNGDTIIGAGGASLQEGTKIRPLES
ncbi:efflux RND transporter periplasmic adaptor subunit [Glaciecola sp. SC05]|uniref:efflux RND transporter periplasmic adaptor subunit n=1 Tax=Glaciecola sp. SC05 TaxID=1987355 RepID=UPI0035280E1F